MLIQEVAGDSADITKLAALAQFLLGRSEDTDAEKTISVDAFVKLANNMGIGVTASQLPVLSQKPPLNNIIANVEGDTITFQGGEVQPAGMTVDQARMTVDSMAKRAAKKGIQ